MKHLLFLFLLIAISSCKESDRKNIIIRGSDTEVNLVLQLSEEFMNTNENTSIAVTGGGSGTGIAALINKKTSIANSSRLFKKSELKLAKERGVEVTPIAFAIDALTFIVHKDLPIDTLSVAQIREIFTGKQTNWSAFDGPDKKISLYGRQGNSGTFSFIQEQILKANYSMEMKQMNGTSQIIEGIKNDKEGIGYAGIGYVVKKDGSLIDGVKPLSIKGEGQTKAYSPVNFEDISNGNYSITRPLYQYVDGKPKGIIKDFILYELSENGQKMISENGYFPISEKYKKLNDEQLGN